MNFSGIVHMCCIWFETCLWFEMLGDPHLSVYDLMHVFGEFTFQPITWIRSGSVSLRIPGSEISIIGKI